MIDYKVYLLNTGSGSFDVLSSTTNPDKFFTHAGLTPGATYQYKISAVNAVGEGNQSSAFAAISSSLPGIPGTPTKVSADDTPLIEI